MAVSTEDTKGNKGQNVALHGWQRAIASSAGGMITSLTMTPLDVVKIRMQMEHKPLAKGQCFLYCNGLMDHLCPCLNGNGKENTSKQIPNELRPWYRKPGNFKGTIDAVLKISRNEGVLSLWSGLSPTLIMALPSTVIYYTVNDTLKERMGYGVGVGDTRNRIVGGQMWIPAVVGGASRVIALSVISPLELLRTKMQSQKLSYRQTGLVLRNAVQQGGIMSLWLGMGPSMLRDVPFSVIFWFIFDFLKSYQISKERNKTSLDSKYALLFGAFSGMIAGTITLPFDVIKTHRQIELGERVVFSRVIGPSYTKSTWQSLRELYSTKGFGALFSGFTPRIVKVVPACALMIGTFETLKNYFHNQNQSSMCDTTQ